MDWLPSEERRSCLCRLAEQGGSGLRWLSEETGGLSGLSAEQRGGRLCWAGLTEKGGLTKSVGLGCCRLAEQTRLLLLRLGSKERGRALLRGLSEQRGALSRCVSEGWLCSKYALLCWLILSEEAGCRRDVVVGGDSPKGRQRSLSSEGAADGLEAVLVGSETLRLERLLVDDRLLSSALHEVYPDFFFGEACELIEGSDALDHMFGIELGVLALDWLDGLRSYVGDRGRGIESGGGDAPSSASEFVVVGVVVEGVVSSEDAVVGRRIGCQVVGLAEESIGWLGVVGGGKGVEESSGVVGLLLLVVVAEEGVACSVVVCPKETCAVVVVSEGVVVGVEWVGLLCLVAEEGVVGVVACSSKESPSVVLSCSKESVPLCLLLVVVSKESISSSVIVASEQSGVVLLLIVSEESLLLGLLLGCSEQSIIVAGLVVAEEAVVLLRLLVAEEALLGLLVVISEESLLLILVVAEGACVVIALRVAEESLSLRGRLTEGGLGVSENSSVVVVPAEHSPRILLVVPAKQAASIGLIPPKEAALILIVVVVAKGPKASSCAIAKHCKQLQGGRSACVQIKNSQIIQIDISYLNLERMSFIRKRDLTKKRPESQGNTLSQTGISTDLEGGREGGATFHGQMERMAKLSEHLTDLDAQSWQKESSELMGFFLDNQRALLMSQQLSAFRESMLLVVKYQQELKRNGKELTEENGSLALAMFRKVLDEVARITQQEKNDNAVLEAAVIKPIFANLEAFVSHLEAESTKVEKRPTLMRKNSLKKVEELPAVRPSSRGKLSSLSKKDPMAMTKHEIVAVSRPKVESSGDRSRIEEIVSTLCSIVKNLSANARLRRQILQEEYLRLLNRYLCIWTDKNISSAGGAILIQLTACFRHLAVQQKSYRIFLDSNCLEAWARIIQLFPTNQDLIFNVLRTLSKISNYQSCCIKLNEKKGCVKTLSSFFKFYKSNIHIVVRVAIIFANMTSYLADIRNQLYFDLQAWRDIYECFDFYANRELSGKNEVEKMGLSMAAWDYQHIKKESDIDCAIRIVRLIANLFTVAPIGQDIYVNHSQTYRDLVKKLKAILQRKCNIDRWSELIATILSCLTNILFYDKELLMTNPEHKMVKVQLIHTLVDFVVQIDNEEICCESLRVVANLTRIKQFCGVVIEAKIHEALLILLESTSKEIVYYCLGVLSNLMTDNNFKQTYKETIISGVISILNECDNDDFDVVSVALKTLATIVDSRNENLDPKLMADVQACLMGLGGHCDRVLSKPGGEVAEVMESRTLINMLLNNMPQEKFICPVKNCGRKFADEAKLQDHVKRRHKV